MSNITDNTKRFYLSTHAKYQLGVIGEDFLTVHTLKKPELATVTADYIFTTMHKAAYITSFPFLPFLKMLSA